VELARGPEAQDVTKNEEGGGKDGERELMEKAAGDHGLYNLPEGRPGRWRARRHNTERGGR